MKRWLMIVVLVSLSACSALRVNLLEPDVAVTGLRLGQSEGMSQTVLVDLTITNPNDTPLKFNAVSYRVRIEGRELVSGKSHEPLEIAAGGTLKYTVPATLSFMSGFGLIRDLMSKPKNKIAYELHATLDPSGLFSMPINVKKTNTISLQ